MTTIESIQKKLDKVILFLFSRKAGYQRMVREGPDSAREAFKQLAFEVEPMIDTLNDVKLQLREDDFQSTRVRRDLEYVINYLDKKITHFQKGSASVDDHVNEYIKYKNYLIDAIEDIE